MAKAQGTIKQLRAKAKDSKNRMPSIRAIHELLLVKKIPHEYDEETQNVVEHRSGGNVYVNDRHDGKIGKRITMRVNGKYLDMDTSSSYYSWNTYRYAIDLLEILK